MSQSPEQPVFLIIAGPNGSGKSTAYDRADYELEGRSVWIVNPDLLAKRIRHEEDLEAVEANLAAVERIEVWLQASIDVHKTVGVETVLSTGKYRKLVEKAKERGFLIWLLYVVLNSPDLCVARVTLRMKKGGHGVPEDKIRSRYAKSLAQLPWFLEESDSAWIYDNSGAEIRLIGQKSEGVVYLDEAAIPAIRDAVEAIRTS